jgi:serine protease
MTRLILAAASIASLLLALPVHAQGAPRAVALERFEHSTSRIIVKLREPARGAIATMSEARVKALAARGGAALMAKRRTVLGAHVLALEAETSNEQARAIARRLAQDPDVEYAEPDYRRVALATANDPRFTDGTQWYLSDSAVGLNVGAAWDRALGDNVIVAVVDTGLQTHSDLAGGAGVIFGGRFLAGYDMIREDPQCDTFIPLPNCVVFGDAVTANDGGGRDDDPSDPGDWVTTEEASFVCGQGIPTPIPGLPGGRVADSSWHGTMVAGVIAAATNNGQDVAGVAPNARILTVRVLGKCGGYVSDIMDGVAFAAGLTVDNAPAPTVRAQVINLSLGTSGSCSRTERETIRRVLTETQVKAVVTAAGNSDEEARNNSPGNCPGTINVAGLNREGNRAEFSNFGGDVTVAASGEVTTTSNSGDKTRGGESTREVKGTSFSAPLVSGMIALMLSANPNLTASQVYDIVRASARHFSSGSTCERDGCGAGIADAAAAVTMAADNPPAPRGDFPPASGSNDSDEDKGRKGGGCSIARHGGGDLSLAGLILLVFARRVRGRRRLPLARPCIRALITLAISFFIAAPALADLDLQIRESLAKRMARVRVVNETRRLANGSGVAVAHDKLITSCHGTRNARWIDVVGREKAWSVKRLVKDVEHDLCLLEVEGDPFEPFMLTEQSGEPEVGDYVAAVGFAGPHAVSAEGTVGALHVHDGAKVIQTDAAFKGGESGGALLDREGKLVGILTFFADAKSGGFFAVPTKWVQTLVERADSQHELDAQPDSAFWERPDAQRPTFLRALAREYAEDWPGLKDLAAQWVEREARNPEAWLALGKARHHAQEENAAVAALREAIRIAPRHVQSWRYLALSYSALNETEEMEDSLRHLETLNPRAGKELREALGSPR